MTSTLQRHLIAWSVLHPELADPHDFGTRDDGIRDDDGAVGPRTLRAMAACRDATDTFTLMQPELLAHLRELVGGPALLVGRPLGERALIVSLREWLDGVREEPPKSNTGPRIREYLAGCMRDGKPLRLTSADWCAASACWSTWQALRPGERPPHEYRAGGIELEREMQRAGQWRSSAELREGRYVPKTGDLIILDRSVKGRPETAWQRHVGRAVAVRGQFVWTLGGNESDTWMLTPRRLGDAKVLGVIEYPRS